MFKFYILTQAFKKIHFEADFTGSENIHTRKGNKDVKGYKSKNKEIKERTSLNPKMETELFFEVDIEP